jgi:hypothetical protein
MAKTSPKGVSNKTPQPGDTQSGDTQTGDTQEVATASGPTRIEPQLGDDGQAIEQHPPHGGSWIRDSDGGLTPADQATALGAGLVWLG